MKLVAPNRPRYAGFTLVEVLLVVFLAALVMGLVGVSLAGRVSAAEARAAARDVMAGLRWTRARAILDKEERVFVVDADTRTWQAPEREAVTLPEGVEVVLTTARSELTGENAGGIRFFPDGGSTGGHVDLVVRGRTHRVDVAWLTGEATLRVDPEA